MSIIPFKFFYFLRVNNLNVIYSSLTEIKPRSLNDPGTITLSLTYGFVETPVVSFMISLGVRFTF